MGKVLCFNIIIFLRASWVAQWQRICLLMWETRVWFLGQEDPLEKEMATSSNILAWEIQGQRNLVGYSSWGCKTIGYDLVTKQQSSHWVSKSAVLIFTWVVCYYLYTILKIFRILECKREVKLHLRSINKEYLNDF